MTAEDRTKLLTQLAQQESVELKPYRDPVGKLTIGSGYNITDRGLAPLYHAIGRTVTLDQLQRDGITPQESFRLLAADVDTATRIVEAEFTFFDRLNGPRQAALVNFVFNVGVGRARGFRKALAAISLALLQENPLLQDACYTAAAYHLMDSLWARQVGDGLGGRKDRADVVTTQLRTGKWA